MTLAQLLKIQYKQNSLTLKELQAALTAALALTVVQKDPPIRSAITTLLASITTYLAILEIIKILQSIKPTINLASLTASVVVNPSAAPQLAQQIAIEAQALQKKVSESAISSAKNFVFNTDIPGVS